MFSSNEPGSTFECRVDSGPFGACSGPGESHTTASLGDGPHSFEVRATDPVGNVGSPASRLFGVNTTPPDGTDTSPPDTTITAGPKDKTKKKTATFEFSGTDARAVASFRCSLDGGAFAACASPYTVKVKKGKHTFSVSAGDEAGNVDATPASDDWKVKKKKKRR